MKIIKESLKKNKCKNSDKDWEIESVLIIIYILNILNKWKTIKRDKNPFILYFVGKICVDKIKAAVKENSNTAKHKELSIICVVGKNKKYIYLNKAKLQ